MRKMTQTQSKGNDGVDEQCCNPPPQFLAPACQEAETKLRCFSWCRNNAHNQLKAAFGFLGRDVAHALLDVIGERKQRAPVLLQTGCSGTGSPALAMEAFRARSSTTMREHERTCAGICLQKKGKQLSKISRLCSEGLDVGESLPNACKLIVPQALGVMVQEQFSVEPKVAAQTFMNLNQTDASAPHNYRFIADLLTKDGKAPFCTKHGCQCDLPAERADCFIAGFSLPTF